MNRNSKDWWGCLSRSHRYELIALRMSPRMGSDPRLPDGYRECGYCSTPTSSGGLCPSCLRRYAEL